MEHLLLQIPVIDIAVDRFALLLIAALAGGAFGAALGALPAFIFTGFAVFLGEGVNILQGEITSNVGALDTGTLGVGITGTIGFGMVFGPHIAFAGGVAATAYAGKKYPEMEPAGWDYHFGKDILYAFGTKPDILAVGGVFGAVGMLITQIAGGIGFPTDGIALSVFLTAMLARVAFDYPLIGPRAGSSVLDMSPFEREEKRAVADGGTEVRLATEPWLPHQYKWSGVAAVSVAAGILGGFIWLETGSVFLGYGFSAMSLLFLNLGVEKIPVTHHITLLGSVGAVIATAMGASPVVALLAAGVFGTITGLFGEATQRIFYSHSGTHVDPPAMAITLSMFIVGVLYLLNVIPSSGYLGL
jgi:MFS family permease